MNREIVHEKDYLKVLAELSEEEQDDDDFTESEIHDDDSAESDCELLAPSNLLDEDFMTGDTIAEAIRVLHGIDQGTPHEIPEIVVHEPRPLTVIDPSSDMEAPCLPSTFTNDSTLEHRGDSSKGKKRKKRIQKNPGTSQCMMKRTTMDCEFIISSEKPILFGKSGYKWNSKPISLQNKTAARNVVHVRPGPTPETKYTYCPLECFSLFLSDDVIDKIVLHTNTAIEKSREKYTRQNWGSLKNTSREEIKALFGFLVLSAALKDNHLHSSALFDCKISGNSYRATMSQFRFDFLLACLRFDDKETRKERVKITKLAPILDIWNIFVDNCKKYYKPGSYVTIDEQLVAFRGRCGFKMYIPSKPNKYGIKIIMLCDSSTSYMVDAEVYTGKGSVPADTPAADYYVDKLTASIRGTQRNVTMDNWFTNIPLVNRLFEERKLTVVGTIRKNKRELPKEFIDLKFSGRKEKSSIFLYDKNCTILSYMPKKNKIVTLASSMHLEGTVNEETNLPEIISTYNSTKGGVDTTDQLCKAMSCSRKTKRWPLCFFFNMINLALVNSYVIYVTNYYRQFATTKKPLSRYGFALELHTQLVNNWQRTRLAIPTLPSELREIIKNVLQESSTKPSQQKSSSAEEKTGRRTCRFCHYSKKRMTAVSCEKCNAPICGEHQKKFCLDC